VASIPFRRTRLILPEEFYDEKRQLHGLSDIAVFVHQRIKVSLQSGRIPWRVPISHDPNCGLPRNIRTGGRYRGVNTVLLCDTYWTKSYRSKWWGTAEDWARLGAVIKLEETPTVIVRQPNDPGAGFEPCLVYNASQVCGAEEYQTLLRSEDSSVAYDEADLGLMGMLLEHHAPNIRYDVGDAHHGPDFNGYVPPNPWHDHPNHTSGDYIMMQSEGYFYGKPDHYSVMLHELIHWAEVRTGWMHCLPVREFVAEAGMHILGLELGVPHAISEYNHRQWLAHWIPIMHQDEEFFFWAMSQVDRACDFLLAPIRHRLPNDHDPFVIEPEINFIAGPDHMSFQPGW